jgi:hypothetical protein
MFRCLFVGGVVLALLGACGGDDDNVSVESPGANDDATTTSTVPPDTPVSITYGDDGPTTPGGGAQRVEPHPGTANMRPQTFDTTEQPPKATDGGVLVRFYGGVAPCFLFDHYEVEETSDSVTITLYAGSDPAQPDAVCIEIAALYEVLVPLDAPLGNRQVIDGAAS